MFHTVKKGLFVPSKPLFYGHVTFNRIYSFRKRVCWQCVRWRRWARNTACNNQGDNHNGMENYICQFLLHTRLSHMEIIWRKPPLWKLVIPWNIKNPTEPWIRRWKSKNLNPHETWAFLPYINSKLFQIEKHYHSVFSHSLSGLRFIFNHFSNQQMV